MKSLVQPPCAIVLAGPNGAGKSTIAPALLRDVLDLKNFVNADILAAGLAAFQPEVAALEAGAILIQRLREYVADQQSFAFETTLAGRSVARWITDWKQIGYRCELIFLFLQHEQLAVDRVAQRVATGGHAIPDAVIRRRYKQGLRNFFRLYRPLVHSWTVYNNSAREPELIAGCAHGTEQNSQSGGLGHDAATRRAKAMSEPESWLVSRAREIEAALQAAVRRELWMHKRLGHTVVVWQDDRIVHLGPDEIPVDDPLKK